MRFDIMTLFPEMVDDVLSQSVIGIARRAGIFEVVTHDIRDYSKVKHHKVDDTLYGGGKGLLMTPQPIYDCYKAVEEKIGKKPHVIYMSPQGKIFDQKCAVRLSKMDNIAILCGHFEGVDRRVIDEIVDEELSIGQYVLTGGELPACIVVDAVARMLPGVLSDPSCYEHESYFTGILEEPQYTHPASWHGKEVPDVLLTGNHKDIDRWRYEAALEMTRKNRPDLLK